MDDGRRFNCSVFCLDSAGALPGIAYPFDEIATLRQRHRTGPIPRENLREKYLPETTGAGCAFLDYDNDGWMDIYLVNSGKCDFLNPASTSAQCALS